MDAKKLTKSFNGVLEKIGDSESPSADEFSALASIESILRPNKNLIPHQSLKVIEYRW